MTAIETAFRKALISATKINEQPFWYQTKRNQEKQIKISPDYQAS